MTSFWSLNIIILQIMEFFSPKLYKNIWDKNKLKDIMVGSN